MSLAKVRDCVGFRSSETNLGDIYIDRQLTCRPPVPNKHTLYRLFFFQAEDGIRALYVTGVQTCALPIYHLNTAGIKVKEMKIERYRRFRSGQIPLKPFQDRTKELVRVLRVGIPAHFQRTGEIGRASCRERV